VSSQVEPFELASVAPAVRGFLHRPQEPTGDGLALTHGAGANGTAPLLVALAEAFAGKGFTVIRFDLPFRQQRRFGPPSPGGAKQDREGIKNAVTALRSLAAGRLFLGGHSYGGRQASMLCAAEPNLVDGLLLLSYPLHPPRKPEQLRTQHFPELRTRSLFMHGTRDPFGSIEEMELALSVIPGKHFLLPVGGAGHDLGFKGKTEAKDPPGKLVGAFGSFFDGNAG